MSETSEQSPQRTYGFRLTKAGLARVRQAIPENKPVVQLAVDLGTSRNTLRRILQQDKRNSTVKLDSIRDLFGKLDLGLTSEDYEIGKDAVPGETPLNPFRYPLPIREEDEFWGRKREIQRLGEAHLQRRPYQIYGERKIGRSSLLEFCRRNATERWSCAPVFVNGLEAKNHSEAGFCELISTELKLGSHRRIEDLYPELEKRLKAAQRNEELQPVIYIDDFGAFTGEIDKQLIVEGRQRLFWDHLRSTISHQQLGFIATSNRPLAYELKDHSSRQTSEFLGILASLRLRGFTASEVEEIAGRSWSGFVFQPKEREVILAESEKRGHHPMVLQMICSRVFESRFDGYGLDVAQEEAEEEIEAAFALLRLPGGD